MLESNISVGTRMTAFVASVLSVSAASGQDIDAHAQPLEEIVVTAQKREERLQDVPISISVLSGDILDQSTFTSAIDALRTVPGLALQESLLTGGTQLTMRGVTAGLGVFTGTTPIAFYVDSMPYALVRSAVVPDSNVYDLDRIEVLRGPQGTLYGASALNGVIRILTKDPDLNDFEVKARAATSSTQGADWNYRGDMAVNVPIVEGKLAARAVVGYQDLSGWIDGPVEDDINGAQQRNYRLKIAAKPTDRLSIGFNVWNSSYDVSAPSFADDDGNTLSMEPEPISTEYTSYSFNVGYEFSAFSISSATSYLEYANTGLFDLGRVGVPLTLLTELDSDILTQEVLLTSQDGGRWGSWGWSLGAFYRDAEDRTFQMLRLNPFSDSSTPPINFEDFSDFSESWAVFGEISRRFFDDQFEWTLGLRHFEDDVTTAENGQPFGFPPVPAGAIRDGSFSSTTPRAVLTWRPNSELTVYGSYSQGFRSGFPQNILVLGAAPEFPPVEPDELINYEIGAKGSVLDRLISFDMALYYIDWSDVQLSLVIDVPNSAGVAGVVNGASASGMGFDVGATARPLDGLEMGVSLSWNDLTIDEPVLSGGSLLFEEGDRIPLSPERTVSAWAQYDFGIGDSGYSGRVSASANYTSETLANIVTGGTPSITSSDTILVSGARFSIDSPDGWSGVIFVDNLNNEQGSLSPTTLPGDEFGVTRSRPRTIGVQFEYGYY